MHHQLIRNLIRNGAVWNGNVSILKAEGRCQVGLCCVSSSSITGNHYQQVSYVENQTNQNQVVSNELNQFSSVPFAFAKLGPFFQDQPRLFNQFREDVLMNTFLQRHVPAEVSFSILNFFYLTLFLPEFF